MLVWINSPFLYWLGTLNRFTRTAYLNIWRKLHMIASGWMLSLLCLWTAKEGGFPLYMTQVRNEAPPWAKLSLRPGVKIERSPTQGKDNSERIQCVMSCLPDGELRQCYLKSKYDSFWDLQQLLYVLTI